MAELALPLRWWTGSPLGDASTATCCGPASCVRDARGRGAAAPPLLLRGPLLGRGARHRAHRRTSSSGSSSTPTCARRRCCARVPAVRSLRRGAAGRAAGDVPATRWARTCTSPPTAATARPRMRLTAHASHPLLGHGRQRLPHRRRLAGRRESDREATPHRARAASRGLVAPVGPRRGRGRRPPPPRPRATPCVPRDAPARTPERPARRGRGRRRGEAEQSA